MTATRAASASQGAANHPFSLSKLLNNNGLSLALALLFLASTTAQIGFGLVAFNEQRFRDHVPALSLSGYLTSGHFLEALFENWESEFLQMGVFVLMLVKLKQKGSAESKPCDEAFEGDEPSLAHRHDPGAPWPVRRGGIPLVLYENSLALVFFGLFLGSFALHAYGGLLHENYERMVRGEPPALLWDFVQSSEFWFQSFQNWQSEFLAVLSVVVFTIFLRQHGSPQSKPVWAPHSHTGQ